MALIVRHLVRDPRLTRSFSRAVKRWGDDLWLDAWPAKRLRRSLPITQYESPAHMMEDMSRSMVSAMNRMQEQFAEDLEALDSLVGRLDQQNRGKGLKRRAEATLKRTEDGGLQLALDVADFKPEDLKINLVDDNLIIEASSESSGKDSYQRNQFKKWFKLPEDCKLEEIRSKLTEDNKLLIDLPSNKPLEQKARSIPIEMSKKPTEEKATNDSHQESSEQVNNVQEARG